MSSRTRSSPPVVEKAQAEEEHQSSSVAIDGDKVGEPSSSLVESSKATIMIETEEAHANDNNDIAASSASLTKEASPRLMYETAALVEKDTAPPPPQPHHQGSTVLLKGQPPPPIHIPAPSIQMPSASSMEHPPYGGPLHLHHHHMYHHHPYHHPPPPPGMHHSHSNMFNPYGPPSQRNRSSGKRAGSGEGGTSSQAPPPALHYPPPSVGGGSSSGSGNSTGPPPTTTTTAYPPPYGYYPPPTMQHQALSSHRSHFFPKDGPSPTLHVDNDGAEDINDDVEQEQDGTITEEKEKVSSYNDVQDSSKDVTITPGPTEGWQNKRRRKELMDDDNIFANNVETPATVDETMSTISSSGRLSTGAKVKSLLLAPTTKRKQHSHQQVGRGGLLLLPHTPYLMNSPHHSLGSFSAITNLSQLPTPLTSGKTPFLAGELQPPPLGGSKGSSSSSSSSGYVYQYQHFDPRSHVDIVNRRAVPLCYREYPQRPANFSEIKHPGGGAGNNTSEGGSTTGSNSGGAVPPTVHMPNNNSANSTSPLIINQYSGGGAVGMSSSSSLLSSPSGGGAQSTMAIADLQSGNTPEQQVGGGIVTKVERPKSSPLDLLSSVSTSPVVALPRHGGGMVSHPGYAMQHHPHHPSYHGAPYYQGGGGHSSYNMYPPSHAAAAAYHHRHHYDQYQQQRGGEYDGDLSAPDEMSSMMNMMNLPPTPSSASVMPKQSNLELMLSAANTLDIDEVKRAKKRKLSMTDGNTLKKNLLLSKNRPPPIVTGRGLPEVAHNSMYAQVGPSGGYYQGYDVTGPGIPPHPSDCVMNRIYVCPPSRRSSKTTSKQLAKQQQLAKSSIDPESVEMSQQACQLAKQALERPRVGKKLLLSMALVRTNPRTPPSCYPAHGTVLTERFHWASYPPLDTILRKNMKRYYELSVEKCQSKDQQEFNNELVLSIKRESNKYGWEFDRNAFDDKKIRDRIRCFYKTHIQNAKKRLKTMLRHPEKRANIKALAAHFHLIEEKGAEMLDQDTNSDDSFDSDVDELDDEEEEGDEGGYDNSKSYSTESGKETLHDDHMQECI